MDCARQAERDLGHRPGIWRGDEVDLPRGDRCELLDTKRQKDPMQHYMCDDSICVLYDIYIYMRVCFPLCLITLIYLLCFFMLVSMHLKDPTPSSSNAHLSRPGRSSRLQRHPLSRPTLRVLTGQGRRRPSSDGFWPRTPRSWPPKPPSCRRHRSREVEKLQFLLRGDQFEWFFSGPAIEHPRTGS